MLFKEGITEECRDSYEWLFQHCIKQITLVSQVLFIRSDSYNK